jgi:MFS family permease
MYDDPIDSATRPAPAIIRGKTHLGGLYVGSPLIRSALWNSFLDGIASNGMLALNETFSVAGAVALRASSMGIALMASIPSLLGSVGQYLSPLLMHPSKGRKPLVLVGVAGQAFFLFLAALSGWLPASIAPWAFVACFAAATLSTNLTGPFWISWMGDLMPGETRGRHFAWRSIFFSWMYLCCSLTAGVLSRRFGSANTPWMLFFGVFSAAAALRGISCFFLSRQYEPPTHAVQPAFAPFRFRPGREFSRYCLAIGLYQGAATLSAPFFAVWYLRDLHFNYLFIAIALSLTVLGSITFALFWGRLVDAYGPGRVLWIAAFLAAIVPIPYVLTANRFILWAGCFYSGASWGGYNLANFNQTLAATDKHHRSHYLAFSSLVVGLLGFAFSFTGGFLATRLPVVATWRLQSLFLLSACLRLIMAFAIYRLMARSAAPGRVPPEPFYHELPGFRIGNGLVRTMARGLKLL